MGKPAPGDDGSRSDRGESAEGAPDHAEREEERSDGRRAAGTAGPSRSEAVGADTTPGAGSTSRPGGNPGTGRIGGCADEVDQRGAGAGKTDGRPAEELRRRLCEGISGRRTQRGDATRDPASIKERGRDDQTNWGVRQGDPGDGETIPGDEAAEAGEWSGDADWVE